MFDKLLEALNLLNEVEDDFTNNINEQSDTDLKINDLLHYIENNKIDNKIAYRFTRELKALRIKRRHLKNEYEIIKAYHDNINKLTNNGHMLILKNQLITKFKSLDSEYKYKRFTEEEINKLFIDKEVENDRIN